MPGATPPGRSAPRAGSRRARTLASVIATLVGALLGVLLGTPVGLPLAAAGATGLPVAPAGDTGRVEVSLGSVSPTVARTGQRVTVTGTVRNPGTASLPRPRVSLVLGRADLVARGDVAAWAGGTGTVAGTTIASTRLPGSLLPGQSANFRLTVPDLTGLATAPYGALPVSIESGDTSLRTFLGYQRRKEYVPVRATWLLPLTLDGSAALFGPPGAHRLAAWKQVAASDGRLAGILAAGAGRDVTWAVDPTLVTPPEPPGGAQARAALPETVREELAVRRDLADRIRSTVAGHDVVVLPVADADVAAAYGSPRAAREVAPLVAAAADTADGLGGRADIAWPATAPGTTDERARLASLYPGGGPRAVVVPGSSLAGGEFTPSAGRADREGRAVLAYDDELSALAARTGSADATALSTQQLVADSATLLDERPGTDRGVLIAVPRSTDPGPGGLATVISTAAAVPWLAPGGLPGLLADAEAAVPAGTGEEAVPSTRPTPSSGPVTGLSGAPVLTGRRAARIARDREAVAATGSIRDDGPAFVQRWTEVAAQLTSVRWRAARADWRTLAGELHDTATAASNAVEVSAGTINFFAESGRLQLTVVNHLDVGVHDLTVELTPENPRLRLDTLAKSVRLGPGGRGTVTVEATALAAGEVPVTARLVSSAGVEIGAPATLSVRVSPTGDWVYWAVGVVAALLLVLGVWRTLRSGRRTPTPAATPAEDDPTR